MTKVIEVKGELREKIIEFKRKGITSSMAAEKLGIKLAEANRLYVSVQVPFADTDNPNPDEKKD